MAIATSMAVTASAALSAMIIILSASGDPLVLEASGTLLKTSPEENDHRSGSAVLGTDAFVRAWMQSHQVALHWLEMHPRSDHARQFASAADALMYYRSGEHKLPPGDVTQIVRVLTRLSSVHDLMS